MVERTLGAGRGLAYSTSSPRHLLNVTAADMSARAGDPHHFVRWLRASHGGIDGSAFVPRRLYGDYLQSVLQGAIGDAPGQSSFELVRGDVIDIEPRPAGQFELRCADGRTIRAGAVVLALGNFAPRPLRAVAASVAASGRYVANPWAPGALSAIPNDARVLLLGTGLTAVDTALALDDRGHRGPLYAMSRHGLLPAAHLVDPSALEAPGCDTRDTAVSARRLVHTIRVRCRQTVDGGGDWRSVIDGLRPESCQLWAQLPAAEQRRVLRHLGTYWSIHRHRMAPQVAGWLEELRTSGRFQVAPGRLAGCSVGPGGVRVALERPQATPAVPDTVDYVVACTGPAADVTRLGDPLVDSLLARGLARPGSLGIGFAVTSDGALIDRAGRASEALWALGSLRQGTVWETTAVPELRGQAAALARRLGARPIELDSLQEAV
jgi:uncharacterized NAD(P)/FAD-binding protein YdhS